ncbi:MAG: DUF3267 domain-containing protein [Eubacteriales bacterium]|nr:DUF3267 domain-containing protein [Eubacteriales bacterium]
MKLIYKGKFDGNQDSLPCREHMPGAVKFKECDDIKKFSIFINVFACVVTIALVCTLFIRGGRYSYSFLGLALALLSLFPHEILHASCFREEVYLYTNWEQGMLFVVGPETMSKGRFILMSMLPNLVFGFVPYLLFLIHPDWNVLGTMGAFAIGMGVGDYYNVFNALTQMPKGARTYLYKFNSYWYMP